MITTKTCEICNFEDLTDSQKETVLDRNRDFNVDHDWWEYTIDDCIDIGKLMGFEMKNIFFRGFHSQGDGACFTGEFSYRKGMMDEIKSHAPQDEKLHRICNDIQDLYRKSFYTMNGSITHRGHYNHERSMSLDYNAYYNDIKGRVVEDEWLDVIADFAIWIYARLEDEYVYLTSDECVAESIITNGMGFEIDDESELII